MIISRSICDCYAYEIKKCVPVRKKLLKPRIYTNSPPELNPETQNVAHQCSWSSENTKSLLYSIQRHKPTPAKNSDMFIKRTSICVSDIRSSAPPRNTTPLRIPITSRLSWFSDRSQLRPICDRYTRACNIKICISSMDKACKSSRSVSRKLHKVSNFMSTDSSAIESDDTVGC